MQAAKNACISQFSLFQLRLDFDNFVITGPSESSEGVTTLLKNTGGLGVGGTVPVAARGQCLTDSFSVSNPSGQSPPVICGTNSDQHSPYLADPDLF